MSEFDDDIARVLDEMQKEMEQEMQEEMEREMQEKGESRRKEISMPPNLPSMPTTYGPHDLPERLRGTAIMGVHKLLPSRFGEEPETASNVIPKAFRAVEPSTVPDDLRRHIQRTMARGDAADEWIAWARKKLAVLGDVVSKSSHAEMDFGYRAYHIAMIDTATDDVFAPHTIQPISVVKDGKMMRNPRHPYYLGRELAMWLREHSLLENPRSVWYLADSNRNSKLFLGQPFSMEQAGGYFAGIKDEWDGSPYDPFEAISGQSGMGQ
ncbi:hypothetical protein IQ07DRAFT_675230 [Pyrenochaeta sp. DS3sAY3a]|nr:hypothetical protein IQ07DRAFT_675230 [Pyrenochaeta sp. DS3sAY3a]